MNEMKIFNSEEFGQVRTVIIDGEVWFCLADICRALELEQVSRVKSRLKEDGVTTGKVIDRLGREQEAIFINEANPYRTIFQSRKEAAERFTDWVTSEVLPSIRKTGKYEADTSNTTIPRVKGSQTPIPKNGDWYDKVNPKIKLICEVYSVERKKLYHVILTNIQGVYNWDYAVKVYISETGSAPRFPMEVVAHFQQFQEAAEQVMDILLERAGYGE